MNTPSNSLTSRREFIKASALVGSVLAAPAILPGHLFAKENTDTLRVGLVGCGGRGSGAASQALKADKNVVLTAMGDAFEDQLQGSLQSLQKQHPDKVKVTPEKCFVGLDAYQKVIDSGVDRFTSKLPLRRANTFSVRNRWQQMPPECGPCWKQSRPPRKRASRW